MVMVFRKHVEDHILQSEWVDEATYSRAAQVATRTTRPVEQVLNQLGSLTDQQLTECYAAVAGVHIWEPVAQPAASSPPDVSIDYLRRHRLIKVEDVDEAATYAACDPLDQEAIDGLSFATGRQIGVLAARPADWRREFERVQPDTISVDEADEARLERTLSSVEDRGAESAGARLVMSAFEAAVAAKASDIHFEPTASNLMVRLRVDGQLKTFRTAGIDIAAPAISRVKILASLDLGERRLPQDGRTTFVVAGRQIDVRVATSPTVYGEGAVLRILDRSSVPLDLARLGLSQPEADVLRRAAALPHGLFLVSGPTGSGKTTTLYALLQTLVGSNLKILSVEDPVEFHFEHVAQTQVAPQIGLTFARALRSFLRQDPNVILVGEIRDPETAAVAVQAAMTGHLVLASVHANDALGVIPRLLDMSVEPYQLSAALKGASAQRLVRRLCQACREPRAPSPAELTIAARAKLPPPVTLSHPKGCPECGETGFRGRLAIGEAFLTDEEGIRGLMLPEESGSRGPAIETGGMLRDGLSKAARSETTYEEVLAAVSE